MNYLAYIAEGNSNAGLRQMSVLKAIDRIVFINELTDIKKMLITKPSSVIILVMKELTAQVRMLIRNLKKAYSNLSIMLFSDTHHALDAWRLNLSYFDTLPLSNQKIDRALSILNINEHLGSKSIAFKSKEGIFKILTSDILYIKASGNYSEIYIRGDKKIVQTKQLNRYESILQQNAQFVRIHRSFIINLDNIEKLSNSKIFFYLNKSALEVNKPLIKKLKQLLLGYA